MGKYFPIPTLAGNLLPDAAAPDQEAAAGAPAGAQTAVDAANVVAAQLDINRIATRPTCPWHAPCF